jgi:hypothetical protein
MATYHVENIQEALSRKLFPTSLMWNRLEGRPRTHNFDRVMRAEVRDALWMLTKQWQMGEFQGDDAGSPVFAKIHITSSALTNYQAATNPVQAYEKNVPLEVKVEQKKIPFNRTNQKISIDIRLQMGRYWLKLVKSKGLVYETEYISAYPFNLPPLSRSTDQIFAHPEVWKTYAAISGRCMDGYAFYEALASGGVASVGITNIDPDMTALNDLGPTFMQWYATLFYQPADDNIDAWLPDRLEYQFDCNASSDKEDKLLTAEEYYHGHLDWYAFDIQRKQPIPGGPAKNKFTDSFIPSHVQFEGMPDMRWWKFEDGKTSFGDVKPATTDISKLLLIEFGLVFANDWFMVPYTLPVGSLANVEGLTVKNNFGETLWIKATEEEGKASNVWSMFKMKGATQDNTLFLAPAAIKVHESYPLEEIVMIRDEVANMVWGIEQTVLLSTGMGDKGAETGLRVRQFQQNLVNGNKMPEYVPFAVPIYYQAMTEVPEHWIPFVPVHIDGDNREVQLQRASMIRILEGDTLAPAKIKPNTSILREGLDTTVPSVFYIHEEEVPRMGVRVTQSFQRTRWMNGEVFTWLGMRKLTGRGEGSSGLAFDQIKNENINEE